MIQRHGTLHERIARKGDEPDSIGREPFDEIAHSELGPLEARRTHIVGVHALGGIDHQEKVGPVSIERLPLHPLLGTRQCDEAHGDARTR